MSKPIPKSKQLAYRKYLTTNIVSKLPDLKESEIQKQLNDLLDVYGLKYIRIEDWVWLGLKNVLTYMQLKLPNSKYTKLLHGILEELSSQFSGMPDNMIFYKVSDEYCLCFPLELKSKKGTKGKKQKKWSSKIGGRVSRSPDQNIEFVQEFIEISNDVKQFLNERKN